MSVNLNISDFSADFFTLDQEDKPTDAAQFLKGLNVLALQALDVLGKPEDVELAFQQIKNAKLVGLGPQYKTDVAQRIQDVFNKWVKVTFGDHSRYVPRERLAKQCGPKFKAQYTSVMKEATDQVLDLQSADTSPTARCPEECKESLLVYLQTGTLPPGALGGNALNMLVLAEQHQLEELIQECLNFLVDNLALENLDTFLEFTQQTNYPQLEVACLNFMKDNGESISEEVRTKYQEQLSIVAALERGKITLTISSSGNIEAEVKTFTDQTENLLKKISQQFPITSLILPKADPNILPSFLEWIAPTLKSLQELVIWNETPSDSDLPKLKNLFPNLTALGNDAPFLNTFDAVKTYVKNFKEPGEDDQESKKPLLRSLNLRAVPNLTDAQLAELTPHLQELYHLLIKSDKITSMVAPKATSVDCSNCIKLTTLEAPKASTVHGNYCTALTILEAQEATEVDCEGCTKLTTLKAPKATSVNCWGCTALTTLEAPEAIWFDCYNCARLTTLEMPKATSVNCSCCEALTTLEAPKAIKFDCCRCKALTTLEAPKATEVNCDGCTKLTTLKAPKATKFDCRDCTALTTLEAPEAILVDCSGCTKLTTLEAPKATQVFCNDCTALTTLEAPKATEVNCSGCTKLTTLNTPEVTRVFCIGCTALTTLKAPKATWINCEGCTLLTTLETPEATWINFEGCTLLTTLETPEATEVNYEGCTAPATVETPEGNFAGERKFILPIRMYINSLWAFFVCGYRSFLSLFKSVKSHFYSTESTR